jgi:hypothetical protein
MNVLHQLANNYRAEKAKLEGEGQSQARRIKPLSDINSQITEMHSAGDSTRPQPTDVVVRDKRGRPMVYYTDGSLRHLLIDKPSVATLKRAMKRKKEGR